jgi:hypothetical protein
VTNKPKRAHRCRISRTNGHGVVFVCDCGALGAVHVAAGHRNARGEVTGYEWADAEQAALDEYRVHVRTCGPLTATLDPSTHAGVLINTKRFGHS